MEPLVGPGFVDGGFLSVGSLGVITPFSTWSDPPSVLRTGPITTGPLPSRPDFSPFHRARLPGRNHPVSTIRARPNGHEMCKYVLL